ncbi:LapA family protein [Cellulomonas sp. McL0617]|uniref:LapA family protein n=1 Tax=Cellulomonas sp. McL0617 TaxID=3415675 RepID=UPI003CF6F318
MSQNSTPAGDGAVVAFLKRRWLALVILVVVIVLIVANRDPVSFNLVFTSFETPEWVVILVTFVLGGIAGWIAKTRRANRKA